MYQLQQQQQKQPRSTKNRKREPKRMVENSYHFTKKNSCRNLSRHHKPYQVTTTTTFVQKTNQKTKHAKIKSQTECVSLKCNNSDRPACSPWGIKNWMMQTSVRAMECMNE
jgi:hypothetical protein